MMERKNITAENEDIAHYLDQLFPQFEPVLKLFLADNASLMTVPAGTQIMRTGQYIRTTILVLKGRVKLYREGNDAEEFFMYYLEPGNACALSMICATRQQASEVMAKAVEDTLLLNIPIALMDDMIKQFKTWYYFVLETYRSRYEELLVVIDHVAFKNMDERLYHYLANQYEKLQTRELRLTHHEIAADLNSSREVISRLLKKLEQRGDLMINRSYIKWLK
ncbi:Crp/Fnr family transcriptional regulator [Mucilaginibacter sp. KACC 22063]|uniref:Crp/Fnr family transcriptional regulator n=1 Tax=Mucilaginibacter sp. KACC 22063 TaxID=3025666 RepID=UPI0023673CA5|nr:Crp/Fnr family transcriptional regulator [Mucilaginibacter sp. KACC 22063]WDF54170.1 Crp/Fnr family transcriptional regulator [Mucilaginibacter sp. KACC 22063]